MTITGILTASCGLVKSHESTADIENKSVQVMPIPAYFVNESPMPYGLKGEAVYVLETSASEINGVYKKAGYRPYVIISQEHKKIAHVQRPWAVYFNFNSSEITGTQLGAIQDLVSYLNRNPGDKIEVIGFTDSFGTKEKNSSLALMRSKKVKIALLKNGLRNGKQILQLRAAPQSRYLITNGFGKKLAARNRRVEIVLVQ